MSSPASAPWDSDELEQAVNQLCPDESCLAALPLLQIWLRQRILESNQRAIQLRSLLEPSSSSDLHGSCWGQVRVHAIQQAIAALLSNLAHIRASSSESQAVVQAVTREIRALDVAKANIENALVGLKRFAMLVHALDQLTRLAKLRKYRETASALQAVQQLSAHLTHLSPSVPRVAALFQALGETQGLLRQSILDEFSSAFEQNTLTPTGAKSQLAESCLVMEVLGDDARHSLIEWYTSFQLRDYHRIFSGPRSEAGQLDNISRRYAWFRRILKALEEDPCGGAHIFPKHWQVDICLCAQFGEATRQDLGGVLAHSRPTLNVDLLLQALQLTATFEREMSQKFGMPYLSIAARSSSAQVGAPTPIRTVFEPYLGIFVSAQDKTLSEMFQTFRAGRPTAADLARMLLPDERPAAVIPSSTELFYFYRTTLDRGASLSNRQSFLELCEMFKKWLKVYSQEILVTTLSSAANSASVTTGPLSERPSAELGPNPLEGPRSVRLPRLLCACAVLNTADYCAETAAQLQAKLCEKIHADLVSKVSLENEMDLFRGNIAQAISNLLRELEDSCDTGFTAMIQTPWRDLEFVSTESSYTGDLIAAITGVIILVKTHVEQKKYLRSICDKAVGILVNRFSQSIVRCRPISPIGAQQMILDLQTLKNCLLTLPQLDPQTPVPSSYSRYVVKSIGKLDTLLKVIMTPEDPAEDFVRHYLLLIPCQSFSDFQKVVDLKGVKRQDQNTLLDVFLAKTSIQSDLSDSSFLATLDMNPEAPPNHKPSSLLPFSGFSRDPSVLAVSESGRIPIASPPVPGNYLEQADSGGSRALSDFRKFGQKLGIGLRFSRETKAD